MQGWIQHQLWCTRHLWLQGRVDCARRLCRFYSVSKSIIGSMGGNRLLWRYVYGECLVLRIGVHISIGNDLRVYNYTLWNGNTARFFRAPSLTLASHTTSTPGGTLIEICNVSYSQASWLSFLCFIIPLTITSVTEPSAKCSMYNIGQPLVLSLLHSLTSRVLHTPQHNQVGSHVACINYV